MENIVTRQTFNLFKEAFPCLPVLSLFFQIKKMLKDCDSVLDVGCGDASLLRFIKFKHFVGVDAYEPSIVKAKRKAAYNELYLCDIREISKKFSKGQFDCCVAIDVIEHLHKEEGYQLIQDMEMISRKKVLIFTPNGFVNHYDYKNKLQKHLSGLSVDDMRSLGYSVIGMYGHKIFRGDSHEIRFRPKILWGVVSELTHYLYTREHPERAAAILCIKNVGG